MHVALALLTLFPGRVGGSESNVRGILGQFADGVGPDRVTVLANRHVARAYGEYDRGPVTIVPARGYRPGDSDATRVLAMNAARLMPRRAARDLPADAQVVHHPVTIPIPTVAHLPTVTTVYDLQHHELPSLFSRAERAFRRWAYDGAARAAHVVLTTSDYSRERLIELTGVAPGRVETVHMGIDHTRFRPDPEPADERLRAGLGLPDRYLVYPANLWPHKNHARLVAALGRAQDPEIQLVLTGQDYGRRAQVESWARAAGVEDRVRHLGYVDQAQLPALLRGAEGMVFPSLYEGFGSPPLEAMACGCPVASSGRTSLAEVTGDAALRFEPESPESIAEAIDDLAGDPGLRERLRQGGLERASRFSWRVAAERHRAIYERAAATFDPAARS